MNYFLVFMIAIVGILAIFVITVSLPLENNILCDLECKKHYESIGLSCWQDSLNDYSCRMFSERNTDVVIPWGSATMPNKRNFIPSYVTVSIAINNTVTFTNVDDVPHQIEGDDGLFKSPVLQPNQTWSHVFDKEGLYGYHSVPSPWLKGFVNVIPLDPHYRQGQPITHSVLPDFNLEFHLVRETDRLGYMNGLSIIDKNTIEANLQDYPEINPHSKVIKITMEIGDKILGGCTFMADKSRLYELTLEKITTQNTPYASFREDWKTVSGNVCNFEKMLS